MFLQLSVWAHRNQEIVGDKWSINMSAFIPISQLFESPPEDTVHIRGWVYRIRDSGSIVFANVRDSTGVVQVTIKKGNVPDEEFETALSASVESSVVIDGQVAEDDRAPGGIEVRATLFRVVGGAETFPITEYQSEELLLDNRHLWIRSREQNAVMRVKSTVLKGAREWLEENEFTEVTPPIFTTNACEGGTTLFDVDYFEEEAYLSQSAQMYLEAICYSLGNVYSLTPSFRAEKSRTPRHLTEYWHMELEEAWVGNEENMVIQEELVTAMVNEVLDERRTELEIIDRDPATLEEISTPFDRMRYAEAIDELQSRGYEIEYGEALGTREERELTAGEETPLFITHFPKGCKLFYMKEDPSDPRLYLCSDLLAPEGYGELIGGSQREDDLQLLVERMEEEKVPMEPYTWYIDLRRYGSIPHSGFGLGIERVVRWVCGLDHIRDAIPFPRTVNRVYP